MPFHRRTSLVLGVCLCLLAADRLGAQQVWGFPFRVSNPTAVDRINEPVASGLALPYNIPILNPNTDLEMVDDAGVPRPVQFKVLSRWGGLRENFSKNCKWVLVTFNADVAAGATRTYWLRFGPRQNGSIVVQDLSNDVTVHTGAASFKLSKTQFTLFKEVRVGGVTVTGGDGALEVTDITGSLVPVVLDSTTLEEAGSVRTVVRQKGRLVPLGLAFTVRYHFWNQRTDVKVDFRLENSGAYGEVPYTGSVSEHAHFEDLRLVVKLADNGQTVATTDATRPLAGMPWSLKQDWSLPGSLLQMLSGFAFTERVGTSVVASGGTSSGAIAMNGGAGGIAVAVDRFWQNFPKALATQASRLEIALWPDFGNGPEFSGQYGTLSDPPTDPLSTDFYRFEGGRWKTHTMRFDFRALSGFAAAEVDALAKSTAAPLMGLGPANWPFRCFAFGSLVTERRAWDRTSFQRYERLADVLAHDSAADNQPSLGKIGLPKFRTRGGTYGGQQMYGWENWGDIAWGDGYSSLHYDLPWGVLINFYRTGDYAFFDVGRDLLAHRADYDTLHTTNTTAIRRGGQSYEKGFFHGNYLAPAPSHLWVQGLLLGYVMTGDEGARESALEAFGYIQRMQPENFTGWWGSRILGWQLEALCDLWNYTGDPQHVALAQATAQRWLFLEAQAGGQGFVPNPGWTGNPHEQTWMHCIVFNALGKYFTSTFDMSIVPCMQRMAAWLVQRGIKTAPSGTPDFRTTAKVWGRAHMTFQSEPSTHHVWSFVQALSYAALILHDDSYMALARDMWESVTRYHQKPSSDESPENWTNAAGYSKVAFRMMTFPNAETKIMGNIGLWSHGYPTARLLWDRQW